MAKRRTLKREIDYLVGELVSDCSLYAYLHEGKENEVVDIINGVLLKKQEIFSKINLSTSEMNGKAVKEMYKSLIAETLSEVNSGYEKLSKLPR